MELEGRVALVTGASRGIGRAIALALADGGVDIALNYRRDEEAASATVKEIEAMGRRARAYAADVGVPAEVEAMVAAAVEDFGFVDILVNNAGVASRGGTVLDTGPDELERLFRTHAVGAHVACRAVLPTMRTRPRGDIVMISSVITRDLPPNGAPYAMAKAALEALSGTLAKEERRHGIHVNVVAPGLVDTDMGRRLAKATLGSDDMRAHDARFPFGRICSAEDVAGVVRFVVSPAAEYMTGETFHVDGGGGPGKAIGGDR
ncbi:MAG TPA: SDR family oxidoreductase [Acidimicrobiia bacterium]|nr:SDR family oxidoreductase [Acidimicrobiia bacterium]